MYSDVVIKPCNIIEILFATESVIQSDATTENSIDLWADENLLDKYRIVSNETSLISNSFDISDVTGKEPIIATASGGGKKPLYVFRDEFPEELAHP